MKKKIYIDFEAITYPFLYRNRFIENKWKNIGLTDIPYCFSIGFEVQNEFKTFFKMVPFHLTPDPKNFLENIKYEIQTLISKNLRESLNNVEFIGFHPELENNILKHIFPNHEVKSILDSSNVSLKKLTNKFLNKQEGHRYFSYLKDNIEFRDNFIRKNSEGQFANIVGYLLNLHFKKNKSLPILDKEDKNLPGFKDRDFNPYTLDFSLIRAQLEEYSIDDVVRLKLIDDNKEEIDQIIYYFEQKEILFNALGSIKGLFKQNQPFSSEFSLDQMIEEDFKTREFLKEPDQKIKKFVISNIEIFDFFNIDINEINSLNFQEKIQEFRNKADNEIEKLLE